MSALDALLGQVAVAGQPIELRGTLNFDRGFTVVDDPDMNTIRVSALGAGGLQWVAPSAPAIAADRFPAVSDATAPSATESLGQYVAVSDFTATFFSFMCGGSALASDTVLATLRKNGVDTAIQFTIPAGTTPGTVISDALHSVSFARGDKISVRLHQSSTTAQASWAGLFQIG